MANLAASRVTLTSCEAVYSRTLHISCVHIIILYVHAYCTSIHPLLYSNNIVNINSKNIVNIYFFMVA